MKIKEKSDGAIAFKEPNQTEFLYCGICGDEMNVIRNVVDGPPTRVPATIHGAMAKINHLHDRFECPNIKLDWHIQAVEIKQYIKTCPSMELSKIMEKEIKQIAKTRQNTK